MKADPDAATVTGPYGKAEKVFIPDTPDAAQTVTSWLITAPGAHPLWSQYNLFVVRLDDDVPGFPPPHRQFPGATHELLLVALEPAGNLYTAEMLHTKPLQWLEPINICEQFTATDDEMRELAHLSAWGVVVGALNPETADAPTRIREAWLGSLVRTLAHIRGEAHAT